MKRKGLRLYDDRAQALANLQREVNKRSRQLAKTIDFAVTGTRNSRRKER
jgi:hypothetical protein